MQTSQINTYNVSFCGNKVFLPDIWCSDAMIFTIFSFNLYLVFVRSDDVHEDSSDCYKVSLVKIICWSQLWLITKENTSWSSTTAIDFFYPVTSFSDCQNLCKVSFGHISFLDCDCASEWINLHGVDLDQFQQ